MSNQNIRHDKYKLQGRPNVKKTGSRITGLQQSKLYVKLKKKKTPRKRKKKKTNSREDYLISHSIQRRKEKKRERVHFLRKNINNNSYFPFI